MACIRIPAPISGSSVQDAASRKGVSFQRPLAAPGGHGAVPIRLSAELVGKYAEHDPMLPMWVYSQFENDSATFSETSGSIDSDHPRIPASRAVCAATDMTVPAQAQPVQQSRGGRTRRPEMAASHCAPKGRDQGKQSVHVAASEQTTVMMRNLPSTYSRAKLIGFLNMHGFSGQIDLLYLPIDFASACNLGYAFVNLTSHEHALRFQEVFHGFASWPASACRKRCAVCWGDVQGLHANIKRYHRCAIMRKDVPDDYKPILLRDGVQVPFPNKPPEMATVAQRQRQPSRKSSKELQKKGPTPLAAQP